jgi:hypothetical protein
MAGSAGGSSARGFFGRAALEVTRAEKGAVGLAAAAYVGVHAIVSVPVFGEDDAANLVMDAIGWHLTGGIRLDTADYRMRTSPLYIHGLKGAMDWGLPVHALPRAMTLASIACSAVALVALYALFRELAGRRAAVLACALLSVTPAMWLGATYGMAHVPGLAFWLVGLLSFSRALDRVGAPRWFWGHVALSWLCAFIALSLKADVIMTGLAFPGLAIAKRRLTWGSAIGSCAIVLAGLAAQMLYVRSVSIAPEHFLTEGNDSVVGYAARWHRRFPFEPLALTDPKNTQAVTHSTGPFLFAVSLLAFVRHLVGRRTVGLALWCAAWGGPLILFWGLIPGNSARHSLAALPALMLLVAVLLEQTTETAARAALLAFAIVGLNYFSDVVGDRPGLGTMIPKTNVITLSRDLAARSLNNGNTAHAFATLPMDKKASVDRHFLAWVLFEQVAVAESQGRLTLDGRELRVERKTGGAQTIRFVYADSPQSAQKAARPLRNQGFFVWSGTYPL